MNFSLDVHPSQRYISLDDSTAYTTLDVYTVLMNGTKQRQATLKTFNEETWKRRIIDIREQKPHQVILALNFTFAYFSPPTIYKLNKSAQI